MAKVLSELNTEYHYPCEVSKDVTNTVCTGNKHSVDIELRKAAKIDF